MLTGTNACTQSHIFTIMPKCTRYTFAYTETHKCTYNIGSHTCVHTDLQAHTEHAAHRTRCSAAHLQANGFTTAGIICSISGCQAGKGGRQLGSRGAVRAEDNRSHRQVPGPRDIVRFWGWGSLPLLPPCVRRGQSRTRLQLLLGGQGNPRKEDPGGERG